jgi:hypothetical protein
MEDRERHRIGISQYQPHINGDVAPQKYNGTEGLAVTLKVSRLELGSWYGIQLLLLYYSFETCQK